MKSHEQNAVQDAIHVQSRNALWVEIKFRVALVWQRAQSCNKATGDAVSGGVHYGLDLRVVAGHEVKGDNAILMRYTRMRCVVLI